MKKLFYNSIQNSNRLFKLNNFYSKLSVMRMSEKLNGNGSKENKGYILCADPIDNNCIEILQRAGFIVDSKKKLSKEELISIIPKYRGLIVRSETKVTSEIMAAGKNLELIGRAGTGVDNIDINSANRLGKVVMNTPGGNTTSTAELTMSMILASARNIPEACSSLKAGKWERKTLMGTELNSKTLGVIGLGRIGREVARWCQGFGMKIVGYDPIMSTETAREYGVEKVTLDKLYSVADFITIHTPMTSETKNLINKNSINKCKDGVRIINCARGGIVNEADLLEALKSGKVACAALDTYSQEPPTKEIMELLSHPSVICTPHLGANTNEAQSKVAVDIANQFVNALENNVYLGVVNASFIGLAKQPHMLQYIDLAERLGSILGQILEGSVKHLTINFHGKELSKDQTVEVLSNSVLKGLLTHVITDQVNLINAPFLADEHGLKFQVNRLTESENVEYNNTLELILETDQSKFSIAGAVYQNNTVRLVKINDFKIEIKPVGNILLFVNNDKPGVIANTTRILAESNINIADMSVGRTENSALGVIVTDEVLNPSIIQKLESTPNIIKIKTFQLNQAFSYSIGNNDGKPKLKPNYPNFGSGPCAKRPGYDLKSLPTNLLGRSHRSTQGKARINKATADTKRILGVPNDYSVGIVPASDTGAVEFAMWGLLNHQKPVDIVFMEAFGKDWYGDATKELKLKVNKFEAPYGKLPDLSKVNTTDNDVIFTWNGTTSGVKIPDGNWIADNRKGLTICDATSAAFAMDLPWKKLDVTTFSWQKVLGGEAAHGIIIASPRAMERFKISANDRPWPMPKIFRFTEDIFTGNVINTPSMLCIEDYIDSLNWVDSIGGLDKLKQLSNENLEVLENFCKQNSWISFLVDDKSIRSNTSMCFKLNLNEEELKAFLKLLEKEQVAFDINSYKSAPLGIRIWGGATVQSKDLKILTQWLKWAYEKVTSKA